jgi:hypothetical protein
MAQSPSWEANWFAASQEIPRISRNPKVHYRTHKRRSPVSILGQPNPAHIPTSHLLQTHPNIIHPSTPRSPQWSPSLRFPHQDPIHLPVLTHTLHMPSPSHRHHSITITNFIITFICLTVCFVTSLRPFVLLPLCQLATTLLPPDRLKLHPVTDHLDPEGEKKYSSTLSSTLAVDEVSCQRHAGTFTPAKRHGTPCIESWVGPRAGLDEQGREKSDGWPRGCVLKCFDTSSGSLNPTQGPWLKTYVRLLTNVAMVTWVTKFTNGPVIAVS